MDLQQKLNNFSHSCHLEFGDDVVHIGYDKVVDIRRISIDIHGEIAPIITEINFIQMAFGDKGSMR